MKKLVISAVAAASIVSSTLADTVTLNEGWNLKGFSEAIANVDTKFKSDSKIKTIWAYKDGKWHAYSSDTTTKATLSSANIAELNATAAYDGMWFNIATGGTSFNTDGDTTATILNKAYSAGVAYDTSKTQVAITGAITADTTWTADKVYTISGAVNVKNGATLTIQPGTVVVGTTPATYLAINKGAKIMAEGTDSAPIIFTSMSEFTGTTVAGTRGEWGGLTILGNATTNKGEQSYEADETLKFGNTAASADDADNSGILKNIVVKNTGYEVVTDAELNGLSLAGVGSGTTIENVTVIGSKDDGVEIWGGTVNINNLTIINAGDDSLDIDNGYTGTIDGLAVVQLEAGDKVFEWDNNGGGQDDTPRTAHTVKNFTLVSTLDSAGAMRIREGAQPTLENGTFIHRGTGSAIELADSSSNATFKNVRIVAEKGKLFADKTGDTGTAPTAGTAESAFSK